MPAPSTQGMLYCRAALCAVFLAAGEATASTRAEVGNHTAQDARKGGGISTQLVGLFCHAAGYMLCFGHTHMLCLNHPFFLFLFQSLLL